MREAINKIRLLISCRLKKEVLHMQVVFEDASILVERKEEVKKIVYYIVDKKNLDKIKRVEIIKGK